MQFATAHKNASVMHNDKKFSFRAHRQGNTTWITFGDKNAVSHIIEHKTVSQAKNWMNNPSVA